MPITLSGDLLHIKNGNTYTSANTMINGSISEVNAARDNGVAAVNSTASAKTAEINARVNELTSAASTNKEIADMFAEAFSASKSYTAGEYVIYTTNGVNKLYQFTVNHAAGAWKGSADTKEVTVAGSVSDFSANLVKGQNTEPTDPNTRIWIDTDSTKSVVVPQIDDDNVSTTDTWSSSKIKSEDDGIREDVADLKSAVNAITNESYILSVIYAQGYWSTTSTIKNNNTIVCNSQKIYVPAGCRLFIEPNGLYLLAQDASGDSLTGQTIYWDGVASKTYNTGTIGVIAASGTDRYIVFRIGTNASHDGNITPANVNMTVSLVRVFDLSYLRSVAGQINVTFSENNWTFTPSDDFVAIAYKNEFIFAHSMSAATVVNPSSGSTVVYYDANDGTIKSDKATTYWINSVRHIICYIYSSTLIPCECNIVADANIIASPKNASAIISGLIWMFVSGGKLRIITDSHARATYNDAYVAISNLNLSLPIASTSAVCLGSSGFYLKTIANLKNTEKVVAYVFNEYVTAVEPHIFVNTLPITGLVQRENLPIYINNEKINGYNIASRSTVYAADFGNWFKLVNAYSYASSPISYFDGIRRIAGSETVAQNSTSISGKKVLCIGDSVTRRGWYQQRILDDGAGCQFIGTQDTYYNNLKCEGYSGRTTTDVLASPTISVSGNPVTNPFWDAAHNKCDFAYWCNTQGVTPDIVVLEFGLNETDAAAYLTNMQNFINTIYAVDPSIGVYVVQPFPEALEGASNHTVSAQRNAQDIVVLNSFALINCRLIPCWYIMIDEYDYERANVAYGYNNINVNICSDGVHPAELTGFAKLGDMIYNYLGS